MSEEKNLIQLPARVIIVWLISLVGITASTLLATAHYVFGASLLSVVALWVIRLLVLASFWLLDLPRATKVFGCGLIALSLILDLLLKLPVLGSVEYGDWFLVSALDLTGSYHGYFIVWGLLLPLLTLTGWFVLRARKLSGWITGFVASLALGFVALDASRSTEGTMTTFVMLSVARLIVPAILAALADVVVTRFKAKRLAA